MTSEHDILLVPNIEGNLSAPLGEQETRFLERQSSVWPPSSASPLAGQYTDAFKDLDHVVELPPLMLADTTTPPAVDEPSQDLGFTKESVQTRMRFRAIVKVFRDWRWEIFTWILGTTSLLVIVILLLCFQDKPLSSWKSDLQITAIIAVFSQISQSAFLVPVSYCTGQLKWNWFQAENRPLYDIELFDLASRGPDGSIRLLYHMSWRLYAKSI